MTVPSPALASLGEGLNVAVIGAAGGIGGALVRQLAATPNVGRLFALSRTKPATLPDNATWVPIDIEDEALIAAAAAEVARAGQLHLVLVASGILHDGNGLAPEKTWRALSGDAFDRVLRINTVGPALAAKHFLPILARNRKSVFAALSARVGNISDNQLGGWHAYRASKAALNMLLKNFAIGLAYRNPAAICIGLHPGTVDTALSAPFQGNVAAGALFAPADAAAHLLRVVDGLDAKASGRVFAWDGKAIAA